MCLTLSNCTLLYVAQGNDREKRLQQSVSRYKLGRARHSRSRKALAVATWNMCSLVENSGDEHICRKRLQRVGISESFALQTVDRKLDLMVKELRRYHVSVAGIQETKWLGKDVRLPDGSTFLHSGQPLPSDESPMMRELEGVGIAKATSSTERSWSGVGSCELSNCYSPAKDIKLRAEAARWI